MNAPTNRIEKSFRRSATARAKAKSIALPLLPSLGRRRMQCYLAMMITDIAALAISFAAAGFIYRGAWGVGESLLLVQLLLPVYLTAALSNGAFSIAALRSGSHSLGRALAGLLGSTAVVLFITFYNKSTAEFSRLNFTFDVVLAASMLAWSRTYMRDFVAWRCGPNITNDLVINDGGPPVMLEGAYHISAKAFDLKPALDNPHALDRLGLVLRNADRVIVSSLPARRAQWAMILKGTNVLGEVIDDTVAELNAQGARIAGGRGLLQVSVGPLGMRARFTKRAFDLVVASVGLLVLSPLLLMVAIAIKLETRGPVLFVQRRVGRGNRFFVIYKFRSMRSTASGRDGRQSATRLDARVTRVGQLIRRTSIDELPQLLNVLKGEMSLVGPRPHAIGSQAGDKLFWEVDTRYWQRHALKPGLTGLAQVRGLRGATQHEADLASRLNSDLEYLDGWSLWRDLLIIAVTFRVLVHDRAF